MEQLDAHTGHCRVSSTLLSFAIECFAMELWSNDSLTHVATLLCTNDAIANKAWTTFDTITNLVAKSQLRVELYTKLMRELLKASCDKMQAAAIKGVRFVAELAKQTGDVLANALNEGSSTADISERKSLELLLQTKHMATYNVAIRDNIANTLTVAATPFNAPKSCPMLCTSQHLLQHAAQAIVTFTSVQAAAIDLTEAGTLLDAIDKGLCRGGKRQTICNMPRCGRQIQ